MEKDLVRPLRHLEIGPSGKALVEVTVRSVHSRFLLLPSAWVNATILGIFARAQERYGVDLCGFAVLANHFHLLLSVESVRQLASFMRFVNSNLARKIGKHYGWRQKFFGRRYRAIQVSDEEAAQVGRLRYLLAQGVKENLVRSPLDPNIPPAKCQANVGRVREYLLALPHIREWAIDRQPAGFSGCGGSGRLAEEG